MQTSQIIYIEYIWLLYVNCTSTKLFLDNQSKEVVRKRVVSVLDRVIRKGICEILVLLVHLFEKDLANIPGCPPAPNPSALAA